MTRKARWSDSAAHTGEGSRPLAASLGTKYSSYVPPSASEVISTALSAGL